TPAWHSMAPNTARPESAQAAIRRRTISTYRASIRLTKRTHSTQTHSEKLSVGNRNMGPLARTSRRDPKSARLAAPAAGFNDPAYHVDILVRRMSMHGNHRAFSKPRTVDGTLGNRLSQGQQLHASQEIEPDPSLRLAIRER